MKLDITKIANAIIYMLDKDVKHLNDRKLTCMLFLMDYEHSQTHGSTIFGDEYIKQSRQPEPAVLAELFDIIANQEDLDEEDERLYLISEMLDYIDIEIITKEKFIELQFIKMEEQFDSELFEKEEMKVLRTIVEEHKETTARNIANATFKIEQVRATPKGEIIL